MSRGQFWILASILILLMVVANIFFYGFEPVYQPLRSPPQPEAMRKPYLAAEQLLRELGASVVSVAPGDTHWLPHGTGTLLLPEKRQYAISVPQRQQLLAWVKRGGHLIVEAEFYRIQDPLLDAFGIHSIERSTADAEGSPRLYRTLDTHPQRWPQQFVEPSWACPERPDTTMKFHLPDSETLYRVQMGGSYKALGWDKKHQPDWALGDPYGIQIASFRYGQGRVTAMTDFALFGNPIFGDNALAARDHATLLWWLVASRAGMAVHSDAARIPPIWIVHRPANPTLWEWLFENAWPLFASLGMLIVLCLWRVMPRFGPLETPLDASAASIRTHLLASGRFIARHAGYTHLLAPLQRRIEKELIRQGLPLPLDGASTLSLAKQLGLTVSTIAHAWAQTESKERTTFVQRAAALAQLLQALRGRTHSVRTRPAAAQATTARARANIR